MLELPLKAVLGEIQGINNNYWLSLVFTDTLSVGYWLLCWGECCLLILPEQSEMVSSSCKAQIKARTLPHIKQLGLTFTACERRRSQRTAAPRAPTLRTGMATLAQTEEFRRLIEEHCTDEIFNDTLLQAIIIHSCLNKQSAHKAKQCFGKNSLIQCPWTLNKREAEKTAARGKRSQNRCVASKPFKSWTGEGGTIRKSHHNKQSYRNYCYSSGINPLSHPDLPWSKTSELRLFTVNEKISHLFKKNI